MEGQELAARHIALREQAGLTQEQEAKMAGVSPTTISGIESGKIKRPHLKTLLKIARALAVDVGGLREPGKAGASPSSIQPPLNGFEGERRAPWEATADEARRLRETGWARMWKALSGWRASKNRGEPYATRRKYLDEMGNLLQEVYDADGAVGWAYIEAAITQGGSEASLPNYLREESRATTQFYGELVGLVASAGLSILAGDDATAAKQATAEQATAEQPAAEHVQPEGRPRGVEEPRVA